MTATLADHWADLATVALLGAGRRPVPDPPTGVLHDLAALRHLSDPAAVAVDRAVLLTVMRRSGLRPSPTMPPLVAPPLDPRQVCPSTTIDRLASLLADWPELLDEWLDLTARGGWRLPGDVAAALLHRFRGAPATRAIVARLAGPVSEWLAELFPDVLGPSGRRPASEADPLPASRAVAIDPASIAAGLQSGEFGTRHRPLLVHVIRTVAPDRLEPLAEALSRAGTNPHTMGLAFSLADLAAVRLAMIRDFDLVVARPSLPSDPEGTR